jgi:hypothetical protein
MIGHRALFPAALVAAATGALGFPPSTAADRCTRVSPHVTAAYAPAPTTSTTIALRAGTSRPSAPSRSWSC